MKISYESSLRRQDEPIYDAIPRTEVKPASSLYIWALLSRGAFDVRDLRIVAMVVGYQEDCDVVVVEC